MTPEIREMLFHELQRQAIDYLALREAIEVKRLEISYNEKQTNLTRAFLEAMGESPAPREEGER